MAKKKKPDPPKAKDLLPPDGPAPVDPKAVMRADDDLEPEVENRKVGIRRVHALGFGNKIWNRANRRSAGNSRSFWRNIEADDPFLKAPARPTDMPLEIYPAQRIDRMAGSQPKPQPDVARAYPPPSRSAEPEPQGNRPKPMREAKRAKAAPEPSHTPEPRPAPTPRREPQPEPVAAAPVPPPAPAEPEPRRLPPKPENTKKGGGRIRTGGGRKRMPSAAPPQAQRKSAAEIRAEKQRMRDEAMDKEKPVQSSHSLDQYRDFVQMMEIQEAAYNAGLDVPTAFADQADEPIRKPKPNAEAKRPKPKAEAKPPKPKAEAKPAPPKVDRTPPKPKTPPKKEAPVNRSPSGGGGGGMDDLFGGAQEGRVRIGKRSKKKAPEDEDDA